MSYAHARRQFATQELRGFPMQELRGLGSVEMTPEQAEVAIKGLAAQVNASLDEMVRRARSETAKIVASYKGSFSRVVRFFQDELLPGQTIGKTPADEWAFNIVAYSENVKATLTKTDASGKSFFVRFPNDAMRILDGAQKDLTAMIKGLGDQVNAMRFANVMTQVISTVVNALVGIADIVVRSAAGAVFKFPIGAAALVAVAGAVVWFKFLRKG